MARRQHEISRSKAGMLPTLGIVWVVWKSVLRQWSDAQISGYVYETSGQPRKKIPSVCKLTFLVLENSSLSQASMLAAVTCHPCLDRSVAFIAEDTA